MYQVERTKNEVLTLRHEDIHAGWEQRYLLISDVHFDSPCCDRKLLAKHLEQAKATGAGVLCIGDWFDAMGGKRDKRSSKSIVRQEDSKDNYFDLLVEHSASFLSPYAGNLVMLGDGNHETAIRKHSETDLLKRLCRELGCQHMGYSGFVRMMFDAGNKRSSIDYYFNHGAGGGGPVTKGVIGNNRRATYVQADIFHTGHVHEASHQEYVRLRLNGKGCVYESTEHHIITPGYKRDYVMSGGFAVERGFSPKPVGGYNLIFYYDTAQLGRVGYRFERVS